jgi:hypothetical protein
MTWKSMAIKVQLGFWLSGGDLYLMDFEEENCHY